MQLTRRQGIIVASIALLTCMAIVMYVRPAELQSQADASLAPYSEGLGCPDTRFSPTGIAVKSAVARLTEAQDSIGIPLVSHALEAHDCQFLIKDHFGRLGKKAGPFVTLLVTDKIRQTSFTSPVVVAVIVRGVNEENYDKLKIKSRVSCVVVQGEEIAETWEAWIVPVERPKDCAATLSRNDDHRLTIYRQHQDGVALPQVGRWVDAGDDDYYIGFQCLDQWCVIVPDGKTPNVSLPRDGRGDSQRLSKWTGEKLIETKLRATIMPISHPNLDMTKPASYDVARHVATIVFDGDDDEARAQYLYKIFTQAELNLPPERRLKELPASIRVTLKREGSDYFFEYNGRARRKAHIEPGTPGYGMSRWQWLPQDEGIWTQCPVGCCGDDFGFGLRKMTSDH